MVALNGSWIGPAIDVANNGGAKDFVVAARNVGGTVLDLIYCAHGGSDQPTIGLGVTPPATGAAAYRVQVAASDSVNGMKGLGIRVGPSQTGHAFGVYDSTNAEQVWINSAFQLAGAAGGNNVAIRSEATNERTLTMLNSGQTAAYVFEFSGTSLKLRNTNNSTAALMIDTVQTATVGAHWTFSPSAATLTVAEGAHMVLGTVTGMKVGTAGSQKLGFFGATPIVQPTGVAVTAAGIHAALVSLGLITA